MQGWIRSHSIYQVIAMKEKDRKEWMSVRLLSFGSCMKISILYQVLALARKLRVLLAQCIVFRSNSREDSFERQP